MRYLAVKPPYLSSDTESNVDFPMLVPRGFADRMEKGNPRDPLLLQVLPSPEEGCIGDGYCPDPVGETAATVIPGVLHKYSGRVLLITTGACPIHCRYCFRRHFPYSESIACGTHLEPAIEYINSDRSITEVILSGGDPLMLSTSTLHGLINRLEGIGHIQRLRIHSRMPIALPERIDQELAGLLAASRFKVVFVIHCNHASELDNEVYRALDTLTGAGITVLNQSVLLRGINDSAETLCVLSEKLFSCGVLPYYLHMLDRVSGAMHFEIGQDRARALHKHLQDSLPGYLVPRLVFEEAGAKSKSLLA